MIKVNKIIAVLTIVFCSCSTTRPSHKIMDRDKYVHDYDKEITVYNQSMQLYCKSHYRWEKVRMLNTKHGVEFRVR